MPAITWNVVGFVLSAVSLAVTLFLEWPRLLARFRDTAGYWSRIPEIILIGVSLVPTVLVAQHYVSRGGVREAVIVVGWALLLFLFSALFGAGFIVGEPVSSKRPKLHVLLGMSLLLGLPAVGVLSVWLSPDAFFPNAWYAVASAGILMGCLLIGSTT